MPPELQISRHDGPTGSWMLARRAADPRLGPHVLGYQGFAERVPGVLLRQEVPTGRVALLIGLGPPIGVVRDGAAPVAHRQFVAGLDDRFAVTLTYGEWRGLQVDFTPLGARRFLGLPMDQFSNRLVEFDALFGAAGRLLVERLAEAPGWAARFDLVEAEIRGRFAERPAPPGELAWAWRRLSESAGRLAIGDLAAELGCSNKHLIERFRREIGMPPKRLARILRFNAVLGRLRHGEPFDGARLALEFGYYDQSHLIRDFQAFAGGTPRAVQARLLPERGIDGSALVAG